MKPPPFPAADDPLRNQRSDRDRDRERERETDTDRQREGERERERDREIDRERQRERESERQEERGEAGRLLLASRSSTPRLNTGDTYHNR